MRLHRFIGNFSIKVGHLELKNKELFNQFRNVLKLKTGEKMVLGDGKMNEGIGEIKNYGKETIEIEVLEIHKNQNEPARHVVLYCAILKKENFELVVQKVTEIGIKEITPLITERTVKLNIRKDRLEKIIKEAAEQSGRGVLPILHDPTPFAKAIKLHNPKDANLLLDASGINSESLNLDNRTNNPTTIFIGPEGGWTDKELELAKTANFQVVSLGKTTLRAETAAIIATHKMVSK